MRTVAIAFLLALAARQLTAAQPFVEIVPGDYPVVLSAPHGGYLTPDSLADRSCAGCVLVRDSRTQEWTRLLSDELFQRTGRRPYVVINLLARTKLDANREIIEAADGDPYAEEAWAEYHSAIEAASDEITSRFGRGLVLDLHGHGHRNLRFELGYLLSSSNLRGSSMQVDARANQSSVRALASRGYRLSDLLRGTDSFGEMLQRESVPATPSQSDPAPLVGEAFFSGGYITRRHGSLDGGEVDAIQLEAYFRGARDSDANVTILATRVATVIEAYMNRWYEDAVSTASEKPRTVGDCLAVSPQGSGISLRLGSGCRPGVVRLYDILGREVGSTLLDGFATLRPDGLVRGVYFARMDGHPKVVPIVR